MIAIEDFDEIIRVHKVENGEEIASHTKIQRSSLGKLSAAEAKLPSQGSLFTELKVLSSMVNAIDSRVNEGFFSKVVVLVEGESDVVSLKVAARNHTSGPVDLDALDIPIISCNGKSNLEKPTIIFSLLGISTYTIWDSDKELLEQQEALQTQYDLATGEEKEKIKNKLSGKKGTVQSAINKNIDLLSLHEETHDDWPNLIRPRFACFENNIETLLKTELGTSYLKNLVDKHNQKIQAKGAWKNPLVMTDVLDEAFSSGNKSKTLEEIITAIVALKK